MSSKSDVDGGGFSITKAPQFLRECRQELSKVHTPSREETIRAAIVTLVIMVFVAFVLFLADGFFSWFISKKLLS